MLHLPCQVVENACANGKAVEADPKATMNSLTGSVTPEPGEEVIPKTQNTPLIMPENPSMVLNHEDALEVPWRGTAHSSYMTLAASGWHFKHWSAFPGFGDLNMLVFGRLLVIHTLSWPYMPQNL